MVLVSLIGPPNSGKSVVFCALTGQQSGDSPAPFSTDRIVTARGLAGLDEVTVMDTPSIARNSHQGEWLGVEGLAAARQASVLVMVLRCFQTGSGPLEFPGCTGDPGQDMAIIEKELMIADLEALVKRRNELDKNDAAYDAIGAVHEALAGGQPARDMGLEGPEMEHLVGVSLLTSKPMVYVLNTDEIASYDMDRLGVDEVLAQRLDFRGAPLVSFCARLHADAALLPRDEGQAMLAELDVDKDAVREVAYALRRALADQQDSATER